MVVETRIIQFRRVFALKIGEFTDPFIGYQMTRAEFQIPYFGPGEFGFCSGVLITRMALE